jgi:hypothetical protein
VFLREGGDRARLWPVLTNHGETTVDESRRTFHLTPNDQMADLKNRLVIGWRSPRTWRLNAATAGNYPVRRSPMPSRSPPRVRQTAPRLRTTTGSDAEHRYASWQTALASVVGIYLITDTRDGRPYVGKADAGENIRQRWSTYAANGHGGNVWLRSLDPSTFRFSLLPVFDPGTPTHVINAAESHYKQALDSIRYGLNGG